LNTASDSLEDPPQRQGSGNKREAAQLLQIRRQQLYTKLSELGME